MIETFEVESIYNFKEVDYYLWVSLYVACKNELYVT